MVLPSGMRTTRPLLLPSRTMAATVRSLTCTSRLRRASCALRSSSTSTKSLTVTSLRCGSGTKSSRWPPRLAKRTPLTKPMSASVTSASGPRGRGAAGAGMADAGIAELTGGSAETRCGACPGRGSGSGKRCCASAWMETQSTIAKPHANQIRIPRPLNPASPADRDKSSAFRAPWRREDREAVLEAPQSHCR